MDAGREPLMAQLKRAVAGRHARMEALPFVAALTAGSLPLASYVGQLRAMAVLHATLEHECALLEGEPLLRLPADRPSRLVHLRQDLGPFDALRLPDLVAPQAVLRRLAADIRRLRLERPIELLGVLYVLEGTTLGNAVHHADVLRCLGGGEAHYYAGYGAATGPQWQAFRAAMDAVPLPPGSEQGILRAALDTFDRLEELFTALYPAGDTGFTASQFNPEAGEHPVPQDPAILAAALAAVARCRAEFPYFEARFQARGRDFSNSDGLWLAGLTDLPATQVLSQVEWLGRVLGNRGIPRLTLERQLDLLHQELAAAGMPEQARATLREAAAELRRQRCAILEAARFNALAEHFEGSAGGADGNPLPGCGALILSAVCDEAAGISGALTSLLAWLADGERFQAAWLAAVERTVREARTGNA